MSPKDFEAALTALSGILRVAGGELACTNVERLASVFARSSEKTTAATLKKLSGLEADGDGLSQLTAVLREAKTFATRISGAKFAKLLDELIAVLNRNSAASVESFVDAAIARLNAPKVVKGRTRKPPTEPRNDFVRQYARRLEDCLGDEGFVVVYRQLERDKTATPAEVIAIAKIFTTEKPKSRPKALQAIWSRHNLMMTLRAKSESRAGRSAA